MDVERLMKDLPVEQLENIQQSLQKEMEQKKEELREMVGRRYRDVLEASTEVRAVHACAEELSSCVSRARSTQAPLDSRPLQREEKEALFRFIILNRLLPAIGAECEGADALSDAFALLLVENIHRQLSVEHHPREISSVISALSSRVLRSRRSLLTQLSSELGELSRSDWVAVQLAAIALIQGQSLDQLIETYLEARKEYIGELLREEASLLNIASEIKNTLQVVQELFVQGDLFSVLQSVGSPGYRPVLIDTIIGDQTFAFAQLMSVEIEKINRTQRDRKVVTLLTQKISESCTVWLGKVCALAHESVDTICAFYEKPEDMLEFLKALSHLISENWPRICPSSALYQKLFGTVLMDKFKSLLSAEVHSLESSLTSSLSTISVSPEALFEKRSTNQFDPLLAVGISKHLKDLVTVFFSALHALRTLSSQYEKVGMEGAETQQIRDSLGEEVAAVIQRIASNPTASPSVRHARVCLALLQSDPASVCLALNKDPERIQKCSHALSMAIEDSLTSHLCSLVDETLSETALSQWVECATNPIASLTLAMEWEKVTLPEVGIVEVPTQLSPSLMTPLFTLGQRVSDDSLTHLLSKNIKKRVTVFIGEKLGGTFEQVANTKTELPQRSVVQLLFDIRVLSTLFSAPSSSHTVSLLSSRIDPFDLSLLSQLLNQNIKLATQRTQLLWQCLLVDPIPSREVNLSTSFLSLTDVLPRPSEHPQRIPLIPRLDRTIGEDGLRRMQSRQGASRSNKLLANPGQQAKGSSAALSALYDKFTTGSWFGN